MTLNEYQDKAHSTAQYVDVGNNIIYPALKLSGEVGELNEKIGKTWRNHQLPDHKAVTKFLRENPELRMSCLKELGDTLWYIAEIAKELGATLEEVAQINVDKLASRHERNVIKSQGDDR